MLKVTEISDGVEFEVLAKPKASRNAIIGVHDGALKVAVTQSPDKFKANKAIIKFLAKILGVSPSSISILSGEKSRRKRIRVEGVSTKSLNAIIEGNTA